MNNQSNSNISSVLSEASLSSQQSQPNLNSVPKPLPKTPNSIPIVPPTLVNSQAEPSRLNNIQLPLTEDSLLKFNNSKDILLLKLRFLLKLKNPQLPEDLVKAVLEINSFPEMNNLTQQIRDFLEKK